MNEVGLQTMHAALSVSQRAANKLAELHKSWTLLSPQLEFLLDKHVSFLQSRVAKLCEQTATADTSLYVFSISFAVWVYLYYV